MRLGIKVPASTSNIGPGFDCLGIALSLYNEFYFEKSKQWEYVGFPPQYANQNNMVYRAMELTYKYASKPITPFKITLIQCVPIARGLGSSATCIIAGILAANYFLDFPFSKTDILNIGTSIEGHPDNVASSYLGSCVASFIVENQVKYVQHKICENLKFIACIPQFAISTEKARKVLPKELTYPDAVFNISRAINIPYALEKGDLDLLYQILDDKMHQNYRFPLIEDSELFINYSKKHKIPFCISGSGSTLLYIYKDTIIQFLRELPLKNRWEFALLTVNKTGATIDALR